MADIKTAFSAVQTFTITLASLATSSVGAGRSSLTVDNSSNLYEDALVLISVQLLAGTASGDKAVYIYAWGSLDNTLFPDTITGADAALTLTQPTQLRLIGSIAMPSTIVVSTPYTSEPLSVASAFGGVLPKYWGIFIQNNTGFALNATENNLKKQWMGVYRTAI